MKYYCRRFYIVLACLPILLILLINNNNIIVLETLEFINVCLICEKHYIRDKRVERGSPLTDDVNIIIIFTTGTRGDNLLFFNVKPPIKHNITNNNNC